VVLHRSQALREGHRLGVFENRVLRRISKPKSDEMTVGSRALHKENLREFYSSLSMIRMVKSRTIRWEKHVARMVENRNALMPLLGESEGNKPLAKKT
jgi:hypothetical protein